MSADFPSVDKPCPNCGGVSAANSRFCKHCGFNLAQPAPPSPPTAPPTDSSSNKSGIATLRGLSGAVHRLSSHLRHSGSALPGGYAVDYRLRAFGGRRQSRRLDGQRRLSPWLLRPLRNPHGPLYQQHYDENYNKAGYTEQRTDLWGDPYQQHSSQQGDKTGYSEGREDIFGNPYTQHHNQQGGKTCHSERKEDWLGNEYTQHYDQQGNRAGRSEERTDLFGDKYVKHEDE